jgi:phosphate transport system substrate-binding protein
MRRVLALAALAGLCAGPLIGGSPANAMVSAVTAQIDGSGSTWAENAVNQWITDVTAKGLQVVFTGSGSAQGRTDFRNVTTDFAVSDIGFQGYDQTSQTNDTSCQNINPLSNCRAYVYLPIVAGGTSFPYQVRVGGHNIQNLRLSGETIAKIFTNQITNWDNPEITADNNGFPDLPGHHLPSLPIIPVVDSQGSGASAQFTAYLNAQYPSIWHPFSGGAGETEYFPRQGSQIAEAGSDGIINFVTSAAANGAIGYDEYSYALQKNWPVALLENKAGYFTAPTEYNVAVALTLAQINKDKSSPNYLLQNLSNVYTNPDKRAYALSSYSYMIIPTAAKDARMSTPKRQTLADFIDWSICGGQGEIGPIGYSPLPINLAQASFEQMHKLHTADPRVQISNLNVATKCHNPTFWAGHPNGNFLAQIAPEPPTCDKAGQGPCAPGTGVGPTGNPQNGKAPKPKNSSPTQTSSNTASPSASSSAGTSGTPSPSAGAPGGSSTGGTAPGGSNGSGVALVGSPTNIAASEGSGTGGLLAGLAVVEVLLLLAIPPIIARRRQQRRTGR